MSGVKATAVEDAFENFDTPGAFTLLAAYSDGDKIAGMEFVCPCGCKREGYLPFRPEASPSWEWNGNKESPTLQPSVLQVGGCQWHGFLIDGEWRSC